ncbi:MAG: pre-peptidase C-terminal domain-containing protein [Rhodocyclaceae bacterium]|nr:pre-peptidase C-terminal domain-containing protein [Rhodocyclaceae bacterium]
MTKPILTGLTLLAMAAGATGIAHAAKPEFPGLTLPEAASGQRAIDMLAQHLPAVARWYGKSAEEFAAILLRDPSARIDRNGRLFYVETYGVEDAATATDAGAAQAGAIPADQTFLLHSRPGALRTLYLDFDGHSITGTAWNASYGIATINSPPYDIDGLPYSYSATEIARIQGIWQRVAEDYAPFDVDVTTEEPPADVLTRSSSGDLQFGTRVVITRDFVPGGCGCGGFAYVGIFDTNGDYYKPAFVFLDHLGNGNEKYVAEAVSHEAGHNMGLNHDGDTTTGYYAGHGTGDTGWAPIMGVGYYKPLVQWSKGEYPGANNHEDDFVVMQSNALPLRPDDHGDTTASATALGAVATLSASGVIERRTDVDVFGFAAGAGGANVSVSFPSPSSNLDARLELLDAAGNVLASDNPADTLGATLSATLPAEGNYYLRVSGVGKGTADTGYTDYGSLGEYRLAGTVQPAGNLPPVAVASATPASGEAPLAVTLSAVGSSDADGTIVGYVWDLGDGSAPVSGASVSHVYSTGSYTATVTVTDDQGLSDSDSVSVTAIGPVSTPAIHVESIAVSLSGNKKSTAAVADVLVRDADGNPIAGALVSGQWSGVVSGGSSATTDAAGVATLRSARSRSRGEFVLSVTNVELTGYDYVPGDNLETTDSASN